MSQSVTLKTRNTQVSPTKFDTKLPGPKHAYFVNESTNSDRHQVKGLQTLTSFFKDKEVQDNGILTPIYTTQKKQLYG